MRYNITVKFQCKGITQEDLDNWDENGGITLEEYVRFMIAEQLLFDITDDTKDVELVSVSTDLK